MSVEQLRRLSIKITVEDGSGKAVSVGSGIIIKEPTALIVLTAAHSVLGEDLEFLQFKENIYVQMENDLVGLSDQLGAKIVEFDHASDWAILELNVATPAIEIPVVKRVCTKETLDVKFRGFPKAYGNFRTFDAKIIDRDISSMKITLLEKSFNQGFSSGSAQAKGLSGSGVVFMEKGNIYLVGIVREVVGEDANFSDLVCCPIDLLDNHFSSPSIVMSDLTSSENAGSRMPTFLTHIPLMSELLLLGREDELTHITGELLTKDDARIAIEGIRGIGKTTIIRKVLSNVKSGLDFIAWFNFASDDTDLEQLILGQIRIHDQEFLSSISFRKINFNDIVAYLYTLTGRKLLVFENVSSTHLAKLQQLSKKLVSWSIIVSSHISLSALGLYLRRRILPIEASSARELFLSIYEKVDIALVDQLLKKIGYHTLTIEIIAKTCKFWDNRSMLEELLSKIESSGLRDINDFPADINVDHSENMIEGLVPYYNFLFDFTKLTHQYELDILVNMAALLPSRWSEDLISQTVKTSEVLSDRLAFKRALTMLSDLGLIFRDNEHIEMHETIQYFVRYKIELTVERCANLINRIQDELILHHMYSPSRNLDILPHAENVINVIGAQNNILMARFELIVARSFQILSLNQKAIYHLEQIEISHKNLLKLDTYKDFQAEYYYELGRFYKHNRQGKNFRKSIKSFNKALNAFRELYPMESEQVANCYGEIGYVYLKEKDFNTAKIYFDKAFKIHSIDTKKNHKNIALYYSNLGDIEHQKKRYKEAIEMFNKSLHIFSSFDKNPSENQIESYKDSFEALTSHKKALSLFGRKATGDLDSAKILFNESKLTFIKIYGQIHEYILESEKYIGEIALIEKDYELALKCIDNRARIGVALYGIEYERSPELSADAQRVHLDPNALYYLLKKNTSEIHDLEWHYNHIALIYLARVHAYTREDPAFTDEILRKTGTSSANFLSEMRMTLYLAKLYFSKANNLEALKAVENQIFTSAYGRIS